MVRAVQVDLEKCCQSDKVLCRVVCAGINPVDAKGLVGDKLPSWMSGTNSPKKLCLNSIEVYQGTDFENPRHVPIRNRGLLRRLRLCRYTNTHIHTHRDTHTHTHSHTRTRVTCRDGHPRSALLSAERGRCHFRDRSSDGGHLGRGNLGATGPDSAQATVVELQVLPT